MTDLYRLVYASKNLLRGPEADVSAEVRQILDASQRNNQAVGVTGALMFNAGAFAQVLEGPRAGVEATFERIQRDLRHSDVTVLQCGPTESRGFANWSMAFVGQSAGGQARFSGLAAESGFDLTRLDGDRVFSMLHGLVMEEEGLPATVVLPAETARTVTGLDVVQVRAEIAQIHPDAAAPEPLPRAVPSRAAAPLGTTEAALHVLKAALASERTRTTELRTEIDALRIALASAEDRISAVRDARDLWAGRARLLAQAMVQEAEGLDAAAPAQDPDTARPATRDSLAA
ncbi:Sensors of blue-light using FAD [Methylobacterium phyllostachyos]|uniref:Sensors of blue-light using FAD n=1 Tax=Methylobacterium phyllostachyos TaxID=582672 RepID=A0A1H0LBJ6_9HYPH|nr:BLUF domain-containing protein [Methylobacterium phyllostachyos]SDO65604.1 Sensors of blue-light using FAD [Methylobacterium phyllostachyos]